jgi:hypothetical protein
MLMVSSLSYIRREIPKRKTEGKTIIHGKVKVEEESRKSEDEEVNRQNITRAQAMRKINVYKYYLQLTRSV